MHLVQDLVTSVFEEAILTAAIGIYCWDKATKRALFLVVNIVV